VAPDGSQPRQVTFDQVGYASPDWAPGAAVGTTGPTLTAIDPASGPTGGGTQVTLTGTGFEPASAVTFDGQPAALVSGGATSLVVTSPAHAAGAVDVVVTNADGQSATLAAAFTYVSGPTLTVSPTSGAPGTRVVLTGTGYRPREKVDVEYETRAVHGPSRTRLCMAAVRADGSWSCGARIPAHHVVGVGDHAITATGKKSHLSATVTFTVTGP
jgi:hypothetical protein